MNIALKEKFKRIFHKITPSPPPEIWKTKKFDDMLLRLYNAVNKQDIIKKWTNGCILPFHRKKVILGSLRSTVITFTANVYNVLLLYRNRPEIDKILRKNQNGFRMNLSTTSLILTGGVHAKNLESIDFFKAFNSPHSGENGANTTSIWSPQRNCSRYNDTL